MSVDKIKMNSKSEDFKNTFRAVLSQNNVQDVYKSAETERKCTVLAFHEASKNLDNASACDLLALKLDDCTEKVYKNGENIYKSLLLNTYPNIVQECKFKITSDLPKIDLNSYLKELTCSEGQTVFCTKSEEGAQSEIELEEISQLFLNKKPVKQNFVCKNVVSLQDKHDNLMKLQGTLYKPDVVTEKRRVGETTLKRHRDLPTFSTARDELEKQELTKCARSASKENMYCEPKKTLGCRPTVKSKFVSPLLCRSDSNNSEEKMETSGPIQDERLKNIEPKMIELIMSEIMENSPQIGWNDIAGLEFAKSAIQEAVVWPLLRPDIFTGLRRPPKGILLFGPPGTGKTLIGKCVASQSKSTFFSISASSLTSKWIGDGEKMVRALFAVARVHQPSVIFIDEVDSLLTQRSDTEHESSRRLKTEFLVQLDGATTDCEERILVIGATNRPQELDEAARRRFVKRLYIPLPEYQARMDLLKKVMSSEKHCLTEEHFDTIARSSEGYSGADMKNLCSEAALEPIRSIDDIHNFHASDIRPLKIDDFQKSLKKMRPSVAQADLVHYIQWDKTYGLGSS